jgi:hypothetical protein
VHEPVAAVWRSVCGEIFPSFSDGPDNRTAVASPVFTDLTGWPFHSTKRVDSPLAMRMRDAAVAKMIKAFGTPIDDGDAKAIADYLKENYGTGTRLPKAGTSIAVRGGPRRPQRTKSAIAPSERGVWLRRVDAATTMRMHVVVRLSNHPRDMERPIKQRDFER